MKHLPKLWYVAALFISVPAFAGDVMTVKDKNGRSMEIELLSVSGDRVSFNRVSDGKKFDLPLSTFDAASAESMSAKKPSATAGGASATAAAHPAYGIDVSIEKRRKKSGGSDYMVAQTVSARVKLKNPDANQDAPPVKVRVVYIGQDRETGKYFSALAVKEYAATIKAGQTDDRELDAVTTTYDSDNKGDGNIGGHQYDGYLLLVMDDKGTVLQTQSNSGKLNEELKKDPAAVHATFKAIKQADELDDHYRATGKKALRVR